MALSSQIFSFEAISTLVSIPGAMNSPSHMLEKALPFAGLKSATKSCCGCFQEGEQRSAGEEKLSRNKERWGG